MDFKVFPPNLLQIDLWMSGCYLWSIAPRTQQFFGHKMSLAGLSPGPLDNWLSDCFCTVLGGANAYLDKYCQFERVAKNQLPLNRPALLAFCYDQSREERTYDFYLLHAALQPMEDSPSKSILKAHLAALPAIFSVTIRDGRYAGGVLESVIITGHNGKSCDQPVPAGDLEDIHLIADVERTFSAAFASRTSPAASWIEQKNLANNRLAQFFQHVPPSVEKNIRNSASGAMALRVLRDTIRHPADAPVLMELYQRLEDHADIQSLMRQFREAVLESNAQLRMDPKVSLSDVMPDSVLLGRVAKVDSRDEVSIEFQTPDGDRFIESFDRDRLRGLSADYQGARLKYFTYQLGEWSASRFELFSN